MCSHRSGESEDTTIADLAVGLCTGEIKTGAVEVNVLRSTISFRIEDEALCKVRVDSESRVGWHKSSFVNVLIK